MSATAYSITKIIDCPDCGSACDGKSCRCGWFNPRLKNNKKNITKIQTPCPHCSRAGVARDGLCELHQEIFDLFGAVKHWRSFLTNETNCNKKIIIYQMIDNFLFKILGILETSDKFHNKIYNYRQEILEKITKLKFETEKNNDLKESEITEALPENINSTVKSVGSLLKGR